MKLSEDQRQLLQEQEAYYEARAAEYEEWWERRGRYDLGEEGNLKWKKEIADVRRIFDGLPLKGDILEPAGGTGIWTPYLAARADHLTVLDASEAMLEINRRRVQEAGLQYRVTHEKVDLFEWEPSKSFDAIFMSFWISHVPTVLLDSFLTTMVAATKVGGCLVILEGQKDNLRSLKQGTQRVAAEMEERTLNDGRTFKVVKCGEGALDLEARLVRVGFEACIGRTEQQFLYAVGYKRQ